MSGGAWGYGFVSLTDMGYRLQNSGKTEEEGGDPEDQGLTPEQISSRKKLSVAVFLMAETMRMVEYVDSGDAVARDDIKSIEGFFDAMRRMTNPDTGLAEESGKEDG